MIKSEITKIFAGIAHAINIFTLHIRLALKKNIFVFITLIFE